MSEHPSVIGLGEVLWDVVHCGGGRVERHIGGAPANFACHVAQHGFSACVVSAVGRDAQGEELAAILAAAGVSQVLQRVSQATGEVDIVLDVAGGAHYTIHADAAWDHLVATPELLEMVRHARVICFGSLAQRSAETRAAIASLLRAVPPGDDRWRVFDVNLRCGFHTPELLRESMQMADVLKINDDELEILGRQEGLNGLPQLEQARALLERYDLRLLILTCGAMGSYVLAEGETMPFWQASPRVEVVDTVGAGDAFTATFMAGMLRGCSLTEAHAAASRVAAWVCTQAGAMPRLPEEQRLG